MKADFSRLRLSAPARKYTSVLQQQGRPALDSDANEQCFINERLRDITNYDVIGPVGGPAGSAGFAVKIESDGIFITAGRYYVDGLLVENDKLVAYDEQTYLLDAPKSKEILQKLIKGGESAAAQFVLEVWQRLVTDLDDPCLREPALGEADTTVRLQTVWRVIGSVRERIVVRQNPDVAVAAIPDPARGSCACGSGDPIASLPTCCQSLYALKPPERTGAMSAETGKSADCGCQPVAPAGYQGLENQLYRIEIHRSGTLEDATFKWSRENGSVVVLITGAHGAVVTVASLGHDANLGFQPGQWVELIDDTCLFGPIPNRPGHLYQIQSIDRTAKQVTMTTPVTGLHDRHPQMRRWDQGGASADSDGLPLSSTAIPIENGIEIAFRKGDYIAGDYWTIPARTATGQIEWPPCGGIDQNPFQRALYTPIGVAPLACVHWRRFTDQDAVNPAMEVNGETINPQLFRTDDCRVFFPPLVALCGNALAKAVHINSISWNNDDYMTFDVLVANGLTVTLDQTLASPVTGASFIVALEWTTPEPSWTLSSLPSPTQWPTNFVRLVAILDTKANFTASGRVISWTLPYLPDNPAQTLLLLDLDALLSIGIGNGWCARLRVRLLGRAIYADGPNGQIYLDGQAFGQPATRIDGTAGVGLKFPSGDDEKASDFESWFYLLPTVAISNVVIQGLIQEKGGSRLEKVTKVEVQGGNGAALTLSAITGETSDPVTKLQAEITLNYAPVTPTTVSLAFVALVGGNVGSVISIAGSLVIPAGKTKESTGIDILSNPGATNGNTYILGASVTPATGIPLSFSPAPTLQVIGSASPARTG